MTSKMLVVRQLFEYIEQHNSRIQERLPFMTDEEAHKLLELELPKLLTFNFGLIGKCIELMSDFVVSSVASVQFKESNHQKIDSLFTALEEMISNRIIVLRNLNHLAEEVGVKVTGQDLLNALSSREFQRLVTDSNEQG